MPITDDAVNSTVILMEKLLNILLELIRAQKAQGSTAANRDNSNEKNEKAPKIKFGEMNAKQYEKLLQSGEKMHMVSIPSEKIGQINEYAKKMGAQYFVLESEGKNVNIAVPEKYMAQFNDALKLTLKEQLSNEPDSLKVKNGTDLIPESDIDIVRSVLDGNDIPVYTLQNGDGNYMNIVPSEYEGQYEKAMQDVEQLKVDMKDIEITVFEQTIPFAQLNSMDRQLLKVTTEQAEYLSAEIPEISFEKNEDGTIFAQFSNELFDRVNSAVKEYSKSIAAAEDYMITVVDNTITINKDKLLANENEAEYFTKVPNTAGEDYIRLPKADTGHMDEDKTITAKIDFDKTYQIYDKHGNFKAYRTGDRLAASYNTKSRNANKETNISHYHNDSLERIELYNAKENKLISIGIESADAIRRDLAEQGIKGYAAEKLLADIEKALPEKYIEKYSYSPNKRNIQYEEISESLIKQYEMTQLFKKRGSKMVSGIADTIGKKCCIYDKKTNQYSIVNSNETRLRATLAEMGYDRLHINAITAEVIKSYDASGAKLERESIQAQSFDTSNAEISPLKFFSDENSITIIKPEVSENNVAFKYIEIEKDTDRREIETALKSGLEIKDAASVGELMNFIENKGVIPVSQSVGTKDGFNVSRVTSDIIQIGRNNKSYQLDISKITPELICKKFSVTPKQAERFVNSLQKSLKAADARGNKGQTLKEIKSAAKKAYEKLSAEKKDKTPVNSVERSK